MSDTIQVSRAEMLALKATLLSLQEALDVTRVALDKALAAGGGWLVGGRFTVADINVAEVIRYAQPATALIDAYPNIKAWIGACQARPAFKEMMAERDQEPA